MSAGGQSLTVAAAPRSRPWRRAFAWLAFLGPFFFATYGFANWLAGRRGDVPAIVFDWEARIPFLAWTIVPYWSIDALYAMSLFLCTTKRELDTHAKRLLAAQFLCVTIFILFPLRFSFERPETGGLFGAMFDVLMGFDRPFNQMPSLHVALLVIVWLRFLRHAPAGWRGLVHGWGALIAVSVLTTYQHHFIDVVTGLWAGWLCVWLLPEDRSFPGFDVTSLANGRRLRLAGWYGAGAVALGAAALASGGWALWLLWASASLAIVAGIYAFLDERAFQKQPDGGLSTATWWLLGPYLAAAWANSRWWTRALPPADLVAPRLLLGRVPSADEGVAYAAIIDVSAELACRLECPRYVSVPQLDLTVATPAQIDRTVAAIDDALARGSGPVLVCCALGFSRSAFAVAAWLVASGHASDAAEAVAIIRRIRPKAALHEAHLSALDGYARAHRASTRAAVA